MIGASKSIGLAAESGSLATREHHAGRYEQSARLARRLRGLGPEMSSNRRIKLLLLAANPVAGELLRTDREIREIHGALRGTTHSTMVDVVVLQAVRFDDLRRALQDVGPNIVHFCGHGTKGHEILLEGPDGSDQSIPKEALADLFKILKDRIRVVVLNACHSDVQAEAIAEHIECVIGTSDRFSDEAAIEFSKAFYQALGYGRSVNDAFSLGRLAVNVAHADDAATPKLFCRGEPSAIFLTVPPHPLLTDAPTNEASPSRTAGTARDPKMMVLLLNLAGDNPIVEDEVRALLPEAHAGVEILRLSDFGVKPVARGAPANFEACADAVTQMVAKARSIARPDGPAVHYYVAGRAALPVFAHLGAELSSWADVTLLNLRKDGTPDVLPLRRAPALNAAPFFTALKGLTVDSPAEATGRVAVFIATGYPIKKDEIHAFFRSQQSPLAGIVEVRAEGASVLDSASAPTAMAELMAVFQKIPAAYPNFTGLALFIAGPSTLAFMAGRSINTGIIPDIWIPTYEGRAYRFAIALPRKGRPRAEIRRTPEDELIRVQALRTVLTRVATFRRTLRPEHLPPILSEAERKIVLARIESIEIASEPQGDALERDVAQGTMTFGRGLLDTLRDKPEADRIGLFLFLHEHFRFDHAAHARDDMGATRGSVALEEADYWADAMALGTLVEWELSRGGDEAKERTRDIVTCYVDAALGAMAALDQLLHGDRLESLHEGRLRQYLVWHLQRARGRTLRRPEDHLRLIEDRLIVDISPLHGHLDERFKKVVSEPPPSAELFIVLRREILRMPHQASFDLGALVQAVRAFDRGVLEQAMQSVLAQHGRALTPWADDRIA